MSKNVWAVDPTHSEVQFKVKHMMITNVTGQFNEFEANAETEGDDFTKAAISFNAKIASVDTKNTQRDEHLKSGDFFDAEQYPEMSFVSTSIDKKDDENFVIKGDLTIKGITKPVALNAEFGGIGQDPWGNTKAGLSLNGKINREEFGLGWNAALETGGVMVSKEVKLLAEVQFVKQ